MLLEDESEKRTNRKIKRLIHQAGLEHAQTIENFEFSFNPHNAHQIVLKGESYRKKFRQLNEKI